MANGEKLGTCEQAHGSKPHKFNPEACVNWREQPQEPRRCPNCGCKFSGENGLCTGCGLPKASEGGENAKLTAGEPAASPRSGMRARELLKKLYALEFDLVRHLQEQLDDADAQNGRVADEVEKLRQELQISKTYGNTCDQQIINLSTVVQSEREARDKDTRIIRAYAEEVNMFIKEHKKLEAEVAQLQQERDADEQMWRERCDAASKAGYEVAMEQEREARERVEGALREIVHSVGKLAEESGEDWRLKHAELMDAYEAGVLAVKSSEGEAK